MEKVIVIDRKDGWIDIKNMEGELAEVSIPFNKRHDIVDVRYSLSGGTRRVVINKNTAALVWGVKEIREMWDNGEGFKVGR